MAHYSKDILRNVYFISIVPYLCVNTQHDVTAFEFDGLWKFDYLKHNAWHFYEIKIFWNCTLKTAFPEVNIFLTEVTFK